MTRGPVIEPGMAVLPAGVIAAACGGIVHTTITLWQEGLFDMRAFASLSFFSILVALALGGLAAPPLAKWIIARDPLGWANSFLTGALAGVVPATLFLLVLLPLIGWRDEHFALTEAITGLATLGLSGGIAGLLFRALHGARPIAPR